MVPSGGYYRTYFDGNTEGATGILDEPGGEPAPLPTPTPSPTAAAGTALPTAGADAQPSVDATPTSPTP